MSTLSTPNHTPLSKAKIEAGTKKIIHKFLIELHFCGALTVKTIAAALLITVVLWLFARLPDPQVHVTGFRIDALHTTDKPLPTTVNYNFTIHNPDLYKSVHYVVLILRISYSGNVTENGATVNFNMDGHGLTQGPGKTNVLGNHSLDYSYNNLGYVSDQLLNLVINPDYIRLTFVMEIRVMAFGTEIALRQLTKNADLYFNNSGNAIISHPGGLALR